MSFRDSSGVVFKVSPDACVWGDEGFFGPSYSHLWDQTTKEKSEYKKKIEIFFFPFDDILPFFFFLSFYPEGERIYVSSPWRRRGESVSWSLTSEEEKNYPPLSFQLLASRRDKPFVNTETENGAVPDTPLEAEELLAGTVLWENQFRLGMFLGLSSYLKSICKVGDRSIERRYMTKADQHEWEPEPSYSRMDFNPHSFYCSLKMSNLNNSEYLLKFSETYNQKL